MGFNASEFALYGPEVRGFSTNGQGKLVAPRGDGDGSQPNRGENFGKTSASQVETAPALSDKYLTLLNEFISQERASVSAQQDFQREQNKNAMNFNARQSELNRVFQQQSAERAMQFSADESQKNRDWQKMMSDTAYTRVVQDLKNAGLNPILAYQNGSASTPSGSSASGFSSSGSAASGVTSDGAKADLSGLIGSILNYSVGVTNSAANLIKGIGSIIPF